MNVRCKFICLCISFILILSGCVNHKADYVLNETDNGYELMFYEESGDVFFTENYTKEPAIDCIDSIYKVTNSTGSNSNYTYFVNPENSAISETYFNLLFSDNEIIAFLEDGTIFVTDMFGNIVYAEIKRDFSPTAVPQSAILDFTRTDDTISITYLEGEELKKVTEEIDFQ